MAERTKKKKHTIGTDRRNIWLLVLMTLLIIGSVFMFMPPQTKINQGLDIQGGLSVVLSANSTDGEAVTKEDMDVSRDIIESRVNALGASEASVQLQGQNQILVQIPGLSDTEEALNTIGKTGKLEFARLDSFTDDEVKQKIESGQITQGASTVQDEFGNTLPAEHTEPLSVEEGTYTPIVTGSNIERVTVDKADGNGIYYAVNIALDSAGTKAFADATTELAPTHGKIVIILDGKVNSAPAVQSEITGGQVQITGDYTQDEAKALKTVLESGSLPVSFTYAQSQTVGPTLGQDALTSGVIVALIGLALVMLYLLFFYRGLGMITAAAMAVFAVLYLGLLATLSHFGLFSLSLAGVAGIVLTIGMAADSSILTLERFREEIRFGRSVRAASVTGVRHGIQTSIDADLVSLVTALSLFFLGSSGVKGFGLTLALGIMCDIVMMLLFKAPLIRILAPHSIAKHPGFWGVLDSQKASKIYQRLAGAVGETVETAVSAEAINSSDNLAFATRKGGEEGAKAAKDASQVKGRFLKHDINFLGMRKVFLSAAAVVVVASAVIIGVKGLNLGIEFIGGTSIAFNDTGSITTEQVREEFAQAGEPDAVIQTSESNGEAGFIVRIASADAASSAGVATQVAQDLGLSTDSFQVSTIGPDWGESIIHSMIIALLVSFILIIIYIAIRFEYKMGVTAIIALLHDIILVVGVYALVGREMNPNTIAALLTILGYSLYDTVVVFHRISDNMKHADIKCTFMTMANHSMNQVFMRSINTTLTSIIPVFAMLLFGSETLKDFAFAMVIGLLAGAYSSIAIACPLYAMWKTREPKNAKLVKKYGPEVGRFEFAHGALVAESAGTVASSKEASVSTEEVASAEPTGVSSESAKAQAHEVATGAQKAKAERARARKKQSAKQSSHEKKSPEGAPEIRIVDKDKYDEIPIEKPDADSRE